MDTSEAIWAFVVIVAMTGLFGLGFRECSRIEHQSGQSYQILDNCIKSGKDPLLCKKATE